MKLNTNTHGVMPKFFQFWAKSQKFSRLLVFVFFPSNKVFSNIYGQICPKLIGLLGLGKNPNTYKIATDNNYI